MSVVVVESVVCVDGSTEFYVEDEYQACVFEGVLPANKGVWFAANVLEADVPFDSQFKAVDFCLESIRKREGGSAVEVIIKREDLGDEGLPIYHTEFEGEDDN